MIEALSILLAVAITVAFLCWLYQPFDDGGDDWRGGGR
jgi:hypothetical protein